MFAIIETPEGELIAVPCEQGMTYRRTVRVIKELEQAKRDAPRLRKLAVDLHHGAMEQSQSHADVIVKIVDAIGI